MRAALALIPLLFLAGCGGGDAVENSAPVANVAAPAGASWVDTVVKTPEGYRQGNPDAPIKLVEYGSRSCPTCGRFAMEGVEPLRAKYISTGQVSYEFRDFMVHPQDLALTLLNRCVPTEAFFPILDQMYAGQAEINGPAEQVYQQVNGRGGLEGAQAWAEGLGLIPFMQQRGLPEAKARQCLANQAELDGIAKVMEAGSAKGITGTPSFFINDRKVEASVWSQLEPMLRGAGAH